MKSMAITLFLLIATGGTKMPDDFILQERTMAVMRDWGVAFAAGKHSAAPKDGWGRALRVTFGANGGYTLRSAGSDGKFDEKVWAGAIETPDLDLVYSNGNFVTFPGSI